MKPINALSRSLREVLSGAHFAIDYFQREYRWQTKQVRELVDDLTGAFLEDFRQGHKRDAVANYGKYFLGSIVTSTRDGRRYIIDGQQRLTTITLLLIWMMRLLNDPDQRAQIQPLIYSSRYGNRAFNLDIPERTKIMEGLLQGETPEPDDAAPESIRTLIERFGDIDEIVPATVLDAALPLFADWLIENVNVVEIAADSDKDAYAIFETMNDRGLSLTPADMLKGYLLSNITDTSTRNRAHAAWNEQIRRLQAIGKEEDADALKAWLRSQHATTIRERVAGAEPRDFDRIGTEFHRWVKENDEHLGLTSASNFADFVERDFVFFARQYESLRAATEAPLSGQEELFFLGELRFTLQYPVIMAAFTANDSNAEIAQKRKAVSTYLDILIARRAWNNRSIDYNTMQYALFLVIKDIRGKSPKEISGILRDRLDKDAEAFSANERYTLNGGNKRHVRHILARLTHFVETRSGFADHYADYARRSGKSGFDIEHIWANRYDRHRDEFKHEVDFQEGRNRIGGLLLLPKAFNRSYGDMVYTEKHKHYDAQNLLARSLHENAYKNNPGFLRFVAEFKLPFNAHGQFLRAELEARQSLYLRLAELLWSPDRLSQT